MITKSMVSREAFSRIDYGFAIAKFDAASESGMMTASAKSVLMSRRFLKRMGDRNTKVVVSPEGVPEVPGFYRINRSKNTLDFLKSSGVGGILEGYNYVRFSEGAISSAKDGNNLTLRTLHGCAFCDEPYKTSLGMTFIAMENRPGNAGAVCVFDFGKSLPRSIAMAEASGGSLATLEDMVSMLGSKSSANSVKDGTFWLAGRGIMNSGNYAMDLVSGRVRRIDDENDWKCIPREERAYLLSGDGNLFVQIVGGEHYNLVVGARTTANTEASLIAINSPKREIRRE